MVNAYAVMHGDRERLLGFDQTEHPLAVQLGGADSVALKEAAKICEDYGYDEINLNCGCPSDRVQSGAFGACLMGKPEIVAECVSAMRSAVSIPITIKCRIGIDDNESYDFFNHFIEITRTSGCEVYLVHARKAWLNGLSPKQNREIPPLHYEYAHQLKAQYPELTVVLNGGLKTHEAGLAELGNLDGVMLGRAPYENSYLLASVDQQWFGDASLIRSRQEIIEMLLPYIEQQLSQGLYLRHIGRHLLTLFSGEQGAKAWRRYLSEHMHLENSGINTIREALKRVS
jgi:tRNA-dihydrouridine synthase A